MKKRALTLALALTASLAVAPVAATIEATPAQAAASQTVIVKTGITTPANAKKIAKGLVAKRGWSDHQYRCLVKLWKKESGWRVTAKNHSSGAYGIPQALPGKKMAKKGKDWRTGATTQIKWGLSYIKGRYGTPCKAWSHSKRTGWY
jgi:hypothetical protein